MSTDYRLIEPPAVEPITVAEALAYLRVDNEDEIPTVAMLIKVAREQVEKHTGRALITQTWEARFDAWPCLNWPYRSNRIFIPKVPLVAVSSLKYYDDANDDQTLDPTDYVTISGGPDSVSFIEVNRDFTWPNAYSRSDAVRLLFTAGYGTKPEDVPAGLRHAIKLLVNNYYDHRDTVSIGATVNELPWNLRSLIDSFKAGGYVA